MGGIIFLVKFNIELEGNDTKNPLDMSILGYQVRINLIRNTRVKNVKNNPKVKSIIGK